MSVLNVDERNLILVQGLYFLGDALAGMFVTIFIFAHSDFATALLYTGINYAGLLFWFILSGFLMERISSGTMVRIGLLCNAVLYLLLFLLREQAAHFVVILGLIDGTAAGIFWAGLVLNQYVYSQRHTRVHFFGIQSAINNTLVAAGPLVGGAIITVLGKQTIIGYNSAYAVLFIFTAIIYFCAAIFIGKLPRHELLTFSYRKFITHKRSRQWKSVLLEHAVFGCYDVLIGTVMTLLIWTILHDELFIGFARTVLALVTVLGALAATRILKRTPRGFWIGSVGVASGILLFAVSPTITGVWLFIVVYGATVAFLSTWLLTEYFHTLDALKVNWQKDFHILIERDMALGLPRILAYFTLIYFVKQGNQVQLAWNALYILPLFPMVLGLLFTVHRTQTDQL